MRPPPDAPKPPAPPDPASRDRMKAEIAQACAAHERYLAEYGSLADAVHDAGEP